MSRTQGHRWEKAKMLKFTSHLQQIHGLGCELLFPAKKSPVTKLNTNRAFSIIKTPPVKEARGKFPGSHAGLKFNFLPWTAMSVAAAPYVSGQRGRESHKSRWGRAAVTLSCDHRSLGPIMNEDGDE